jgi:predicted hydrocarbon binding protein
MANKHLEAIEELQRQLNRWAGKKAREKVLEGSGSLDLSADSEQVSLWVKGAMERLDAAIDAKTRNAVMENCGRNCARVNHKTVDRVVAKRKKYGSLDEFLEAEKDKLLPGMRLEKDGRILYQYYMPRSFHPPRRCFCSLLRGLPARECVSPTYCQCSRGFVLSMWERVLGKPVKVDVMETAVTGAKECRFRIRL